MNTTPHKDKDAPKTSDAKAHEVKTADAKITEAAPKDEAKDEAKEVGAIVNVGDPGYAAQALPDTGGYVNIAERIKDDKDFADRAVESDNLPQATVDEMSAGRDALDRRNGTGKRRLDDADAADIRTQRRERGEAGSAGSKK